MYGTPEAETTNATYEKTKGKIMIGFRMSERFPVNFPSKSDSAPSPLLFHD